MNKERLGNFIGDERKALGLTQKDLAARLHVTDKAVSKWERGLSYPDVTLLEPLAAALDLGVEELMACRRQETKKEDDTMKALLDISNDSVRAEKRRGRWAMVIVILCMLAITAVAMLYTTAVVSEQQDNAIILKETVNGVHYLYVQEGSQLLKLKCGKDVDFDAIVPGEEANYRMTYRWNKWTYQGVVTLCEETNISSLGGIRSEIGSIYGLDYNPDVGDTLFGYKDVSCEIEDAYPLLNADNLIDPLYTYVFWKDYGTDQEERLLTVKDCLCFIQADTDGDGVMELVVRTRWEMKPYTIYDMVDGDIVESWPDAVPEELAERLLTPSEEYALYQQTIQETQEQPPEAEQDHSGDIVL